MIRLVSLSLLCVVACGGPQPPADAGTDAGADAGIDAGTDAGVDAGADAGIDAGGDAGTDAGSDAGMATCVPPANGGYVAPDGGVQPTYSDIAKKIFMAKGCALCHYDGNQSSALVLDPSVAYQQLVNQPVTSQDMPTGYALRVVPGDPQHSALSAVVEESPDMPSTLHMPQGQPKLSQQAIDAINGWIANCAPNN